MDESEIIKFTNLSSQWWEGDGFTALHRINPIRVEYVLSHVEKRKEKIRLLDVGCGGGILCEAMARQGYDVTGIDPCKESIAVAIQHAEKGALAIDYRALEVDEYMNLHGHSSYDVITLMEVIEHVSDFPYLINNLSKLLHCGGYLFISSLNRTLKSMFLGIFVAEYILNMVPRGTHKWKKFVKPSEIDCALRDNGFVTTDIKGISYNIFQDRWHLSSDVGVNYILVARKV